MSGGNKGFFTKKKKICSYTSDLTRLISVFVLIMMKRIYLPKGKTLNINKRNRGTKKKTSSSSWDDVCVWNLIFFNC